MRREVRAKFSQDLDVVNKAKVNGLQKAWMYQRFVVPRLAWPFTVYGFPVSLAEDMRGRSKPVAEKVDWYKSTDLGLLYTG